MVEGVRKHLKKAGVNREDVSIRMNRPPMTRVTYFYEEQKRNSEGTRPKKQCCDFQLQKLPELKKLFEVVSKSFKQKN